jgi:GT2 family glycosyltransferase
MTETTTLQVTDLAHGSNDAQSSIISVVIPVRNEEAMIGRSLDALSSLDYSRERFDVIIVDNGSTDNTIEVVKAFADRLRITIVCKPDVRISALRNTGARIGKGPILAFLDADCLPRPDWLNTAVKLVAQHETAIIGSPYLIPPGSSWVACAWQELGAPPTFAPVSYVPSGDLIVRRAVFESIGGFNESIQTNEDCEFCLRARMLGFPVYASAALAVVHLGTPQTISQFVRKHHWHGTHVFRVFRQNVKTLQNAKPLAFALCTLLSSIGVISGAALAVLCGKLALLIISVGVLFFMPLALATQHAISHRKPANLVPLFALFLAYGMARAASLLNPNNW